jgi:hypothetical protein
VQDEIGAKLQRALENRRCEGVVDQAESAVGVGNFCRRSDVADPEQRVGRRFDPDKPGAPGRRALDFSDAGGFNKGKREPEILQYGAKKPIGAAVDVARGDNMISCFEQEHRSCSRAHAGGKSKAIFGRLQARERRLQRGPCWVICARVVVTFVNAGRALRERARLVDRNSDRPGRGFGLLSGMNGAGSEFHGRLTPASLRSRHQICPPK